MFGRRLMVVMSVALAIDMAGAARLDRQQPNLDQEYEMATTRPEIESLLKSFTDHDDLEALTRALQLVQQLQPAASPSSAAAAAFRDDKLGQYFAILNAVDEKLIPDFDFNDVPQLSVSPPIESGLPAGVAPSSIADPRVRFEYEQAVLANQRKAARYAFQKKLKKIAQKAADQTQGYIAAEFFATDEDTSTVYRLITAVIADEARKSRLIQFTKSTRGLR